MKPAFSVVFFTTIAGAAQGLVVAIALALVAGVSMDRGFLSMCLVVVEGMLLIGLGASFGHLGRPERAWRAALMWRTSWLSREVIVLPTFIAVNAVWWLALRNGSGSLLLEILAVTACLVAALLWYCTAMIYACLRFIQEWAQPLTLVNFPLIGLSSGLILCSCLAGIAGQQSLLRAVGPFALAFTLLGFATRALSLRHNAQLNHRSTLQTATGIRGANLTQKSMGMSAGSFNTREFFHGRSDALLHRVMVIFMVLCFVGPAALAAWGVASGATLPWLLAVLCLVPGLTAERWFFFAQARHPQNLYYQQVS